MTDTPIEEYEEDVVIDPQDARMIAGEDTTPEREDTPDAREEDGDGYSDNEGKDEEE